MTLGAKPRSRHVRWLQRRDEGDRQARATRENKAVVRRFGDEVTTGRNTDPDLIDELIDELLAPNYVNLAMGPADPAALKADAPPPCCPAMKEARVDDLELVAQGDAVTARFNHGVTLRDRAARRHTGALAYYRLAHGKIAVNGR